MKFLVVTVGRYPVPHEAALTLMEAMKGWVERYEGKMGGSSELTPVTLRVTTILRPEDGQWKIVHRHADPSTSLQSCCQVAETMNAARMSMGACRSC